MVARIDNSLKIQGMIWVVFIDGYLMEVAKWGGLIDFVHVNGKKRRLA
jgi:hypothetical protein